MQTTTVTDQHVDEHVHSHGHEGGHHHTETFISKYIFSLDHKTIGKQFLTLGMLWAIVGGGMSVLFRVQLGWPDETFPILERMFLFLVYRW
jgi:cytochrome c oxidase subunit 1